jgi:hypothetical protein
MFQIFSLYVSVVTLSIQRSLIAIREGGISPGGRHAVQRGLPDWTIRSAPSFRAQPFLQRIIDQELDVRLGHRGIFLAKLSLKGRTFRGDVPFTRLLRCLTGLLIQCRSFLG